jgi:hypothetical protein
MVVIAVAALIIAVTLAAVYFGDDHASQNQPISTTGQSP